MSMSLIYYMHIFVWGVGVIGSLKPVIAQHLAVTGYGGMGGSGGQKTSWSYMKVFTKLNQKLFTE